MLGSKKGFTVIEMLLALALFSLLGVIIINVYLLAISAQRQTVAREELASNLRYVLESIAQRVRTGEIDYRAAYDRDNEPGIQGVEEELSLLDPAGNTFVYFVQGGELKLSYNGQESSLTNINDIAVTNLSFYISPITDPFMQERCNDALNPTGCFVAAPTVPACTVDDPATTERLGFCQCSSGDQCASGYCDTAEGICLPFDIQPRVTIGITTESSEIRDLEIKQLNLQTTVSSRAYRR